MLGQRAALGKGYGQRAKRPRSQVPGRHASAGLRRPNKPLHLATVDRIVQRGLSAGRINLEGIDETNPCLFWYGGRTTPEDANARRTGYPSGKGRLTEKSPEGQ